MAKPKYVPSEFAVEPVAFGKRTVTWCDVQDAVDRGRLDAAKLQHHTALAVRAWLRARHLRQRDFAQSIGFGPERLSRMLNGAAPLALDDLLVLLGGIDVPLARVVTEALTPDEANQANLNYLLRYLDRQREQVAARIADTAPARPST